MRNKLYKIISNFTIVQWQGCPPPTNEEVYMQLTDFLIGNNIVVLPVKPGDTVYTLRGQGVKEWKVYFVGMNTDGDFKFTMADKGFTNMREMWSYDIGDFVFLTEEDAINALKEVADE